MVHKAWSRTRGEYIAIKRVEKRIVHDRKAHARLQDRLIRLDLAVISQGRDDVLRLFECTEDNLFYYMKVELAPGGDLCDLLIRKGRMLEDDARTLLRRLLVSRRPCPNRRSRSSPGPPSDHARA